MKEFKMNRTLVTAAFLMIGSIMLTSCGGVSKRGKELREQAYSRMDEVNAGLIHEQATTAFETGQLDKAMDLADQAVARFPKGPGNHVLRGRVLMEVDRLAEAERSFQEAISLNEELAEAHYFLGIVFERLSRDDLAYESFKTAMDLESDRLQFVMAAAECLMFQNRLKEASEVIDGRFDDFEHNAALHHLHGQLMIMKGETDKASSAYEMASLLAPDDSNLLEEWARLRHRQGDHSGVLNCMAELRQLHGKTPGVDLKLLEARSLLLVGRHADARNAYLELVEKHPDNLQIWREFGLFAWDVQDWRSVGRWGQRLKAAGDRTARTQLFLAVAAREADDLKTSRALLQDLLKWDPDNAMAGALLAGVCLRQGDSAAAEKAWEVAVKSAPQPSDGTLVTGVIGNGH
jgi:tetratricopeptide (TPR) repeat protein